MRGSGFPFAIRMQKSARHYYSHPLSHDKIDKLQNHSFKKIKKLRMQRKLNKLNSRKWQALHKSRDHSYSHS